jgi:hypothetical protein
MCNKLRNFFTKEINYHRVVRDRKDDRLVIFQSLTAYLCLYFEKPGLRALQLFIERDEVGAIMNEQCENLHMKTNRKRVMKFF